MENAYRWFRYLDWILYQIFSYMSTIIYLQVYWKGDFIPELYVELPSRLAPARPITSSAPRHHRSPSNRSIPASDAARGVLFSWLDRNPSVEMDCRGGNHGGKKLIDWCWLMLPCAIGVNLTWRFQGFPADFPFEVRETSFFDRFWGRVWGVI